MWSSVRKGSSLISSYRERVSSVGTVFRNVTVDVPVAAVLTRHHNFDITPGEKGISDIDSLIPPVPKLTAFEDLVFIKDPMKPKLTV